MSKLNHREFLNLPGYAGSSEDIVKVSFNDAEYKGSISIISSGERLELTFKNLRLREERNNAIYQLKVLATAIDLAGQHLAGLPEPTSYIDEYGNVKAIKGRS